MPVAASESSPPPSGETAGRGGGFAAAIALLAEEKKLGQLLPPERKGEVGENSKERDANDCGNPEFLLPRAERLGMDAGDRAAKDDQPDECEANPNLTVEFCCMETEPAENIAHKK